MVSLKHGERSAGYIRGVSKVQRTFGVSNPCPSHPPPDLPPDLISQSPACSNCLLYGGGTSFVSLGDLTSLRLHIVLSAVRRPARTASADMLVLLAPCMMPMPLMAMIMLLSMPAGAWAITDAAQSASDTRSGDR